MLVLGALGLVSVVFEAVGISIFLPVFQYARFEGDIAQLTEYGGFWNKTVDLFHVVGLEVNLAILLVTAMIAFLIRQGFLLWSNIYRAEIRARFNKSMRDRLFERFLDSTTEYQETISSGELANAMTTEVNRATSIVVMPIDIVVNLLLGSIYVVIMMLLSIPMTIMAIIILIIASQLPRRWIKQSVSMGREQANVNTQLSRYLLQRLRTPRLIRLEGNKQKELSEFFEFTERQKYFGVKKFTLKTKTQVIIEPFVIFISTIFIYVAVTKYKLPLEVIGIYLVISFRLIPVARTILGMWQGLKGNIGSFEAVDQRFRAMENNREELGGANKVGKVELGIEIRDVSYQYKQSDEESLRGISLKLDANQFTALVGPSGSGKSTLVDLLPRLRRPKSGVVLLDGLPLESYSFASLRSAIRYVPQNPMMFSGSLREHVCYGKSDIDESRLREVLSITDANSFVDDLPNGIDTYLHEDGMNLSGGQRQRLELARVLYSEAPILILDEPSVGLDVVSETLFHDVLIKLKNVRNKTILLVAHSLRHVKHADKIVVIRKGKLEAQGPHLDLYAESGWYRRAWNLTSGQQGETPDQVIATH